MSPEDMKLVGGILAAGAFLLLAAIVAFVLFDNRRIR